MFRIVSGSTSETGLGITTCFSISNTETAEDAQKVFNKLFPSYEFDYSVQIDKISSLEESYRLFFEDNLPPSVNKVLEDIKNLKAKFEYSSIKHMNYS